MFADADLARELGELTRQANRANVTIYTIDPRGLVGMGDIDEQVDPQQWNEYRAQVAGQPARDRGGNRRHCGRQPERLQQGAEAHRSTPRRATITCWRHYSKNPDATKRRRADRCVKVTRKSAQVWFRKEYVLKPTPKPVDSTKK